MSSGATLGMSKTYNSNSLPQKDTIQYSIDFIQEAIDVLDVPSVNIIADFGSSQGRNSISLPKMQLDVETLFNCYDLDKNGFIEPKELRKVMKRLTGEKLSKQDIHEMIRVGDKNGDGLLDKTEFALLCSAF